MMRNLLFLRGQVLEEQVMNNKVLKLTTLTALTIAFGTFAMINTANADSSVDITNVQQPTYTVQENAANYNNVTDAQQINFPNDYRLGDLQNVKDDTATQEFDQVARPGLIDNNYQSNAAAAAQNADINQLNNQQVNKINQYALDLVNNARASFGETQFTQSQGTINAVQEMAQQYQNKNASLLNGHSHDQSILGGDSENISAMQIYADNINGLRATPFAEAKGSDFVDQNHIPLFSISNMDDLRAMVFYGVTTMLFNDASDHYGHAQNFLTNYQVIPTMAVYPSIINDEGTGTVSDGSTFKYKLKDIDMHFIWAEPSEAPQSLGNDGWQQIAGRWYYYNDNSFATNWQQIGGRWYYFSPNGAASTGWFQTAVGNWYYLDPTNAWADTGWQRINGRWYYFDDQNAWAMKGWFQTPAGNWYYFNPTNAWADTGWQRINGRWYYFDDQNAWAMKGWFQTSAGNWYYFNPTNAWADTGWQWINGQWYYFDDQGKMLTGRVLIGGRYSDFDSNGHWLGYVN